MSTAVFLYCCPDCLAHLNNIGWATWAVWAAIKNTANWEQETVDESNQSSALLRGTSFCAKSCTMYKWNWFNVIHAQLRMNCSNLNAHLHNLHVIDSPACVCSHSIEDTAHFFLYCPLYYTQRLALQNIVSRYTEFKLETLLFGDTNIDNEDNITIILAVHDYIKNLERF